MNDLVRELQSAELDWIDCDDAENAALARDAANYIETLEKALNEIKRRSEICIQQNTGRWDMKIEHDRRSYNIIKTNADIARRALK